MGPAGREPPGAAQRNAVPFAWLDPEADPEAGAACEALGVGVGDLPVLVSTGGQVLRNPTEDRVADLLGLRPRRNPAGDKAEREEEFRDLLILGAGPAGLAAAVYAASEGVDVLVCDAAAPGGQAGSSSRIENYPGFPLGISGGELADRMAVQAQKFGAELRVPYRAVCLDASPGGLKRVRFEGGAVVQARAVLLATGASYRRLGLDKESLFAGTSVYYGATQQEANLCADETVAVVGGGNSAGQAAMFLSGKARHVLMLVRGDSLGSSMSRYLIDRLEAAPDVEIRYRSRVLALHGDEAAGRLRAATLETDGVVEDRDLDGVFVMIGADPCTGWIEEPIELDADGFVLTGPAIGGRWPLMRQPFSLETALPGVFAAGDARSGSTKRVATSAGEGAMAVQGIHAVLAEALAGLRRPAS